MYANSRRADIVANKGRATAFLRVNRPVEFPLDLRGFLSAPNRTLDLMNEAESHLAIAKEQIKYAQFWFLKMTPIDDVAFNHLLAGNMSGAIEIWSKQESLSSLQNKLVCYLIEDKHRAAVLAAEKLYDKFGDEYINKVDENCTLKMSGTELLHLFLESLGDEIGYQKIIGEVVGADAKAFIRSKAIGPLINKISSEVDKTKKVDHKDPKARIEAARKLVANTKEAIAQLKSILPATNSQYQMIADKLGLEILQCGIDYFNNSEDNDKHQTAMKIQKYAQTIVVGTLAKQRCEENVKILKDIIDKLPPEEAKKEHDHLQGIIALFILLPIDVDAILKFLSDTRADLISIKTKLGKHNPFYIQQATLIAQIALSKSIDALNEAQEEELPKLNGTERDDAIYTMRHVFAASWEIMLWIELIDADTDFKVNRLKTNKEALKNILDQVDALKTVSVVSRMFGGSYSVFEGCASDVTVDQYIYYTDEEHYHACKTLDDFKNYKKKFPKGKHSTEVEEQIDKLEDDLKFKSAYNESGYKAYLIAYPAGRHSTEAKKKLAEIEKIHTNIRLCQNLGQCIDLIGKCNGYEKELEDKAFSLCQKKKDYQLYIDKFGQNSKHYYEAYNKATSSDNDIDGGCLFFIIITVIAGIIGAIVGGGTGFIVGVVMSCIAAGCQYLKEL